MRIAVVSHKLCWQEPASSSGYATDGGFPVQMAAISELFDEMRVVVPCETIGRSEGTTALEGNDLRIVPLSVPKGRGIRRKLDIVRWLLINGPKIWREVAAADAVHTPIPGDVGTIGMVLALVQRKPLFVRHCGNWMVQRTLAERAWKWSMERFAGGRNVMFATGGQPEPPSRRNPNLRWIFSTSLRLEDINGNAGRELPDDGKIRLVIACRQEPRKGASIVIESLPGILENFPDAFLDVVGDGSLLQQLKEQAAASGRSDRIKFHGKVGQHEVIRILKNAHVFCYPTSASEGFPKVVLEALSSGLPVITTNVSVLPQLITPDCGVVLEVPAASAVARAVNEICSDPMRYREMSLRAIEIAKEYSLEKWRDEIGTALRQAWHVSHLSAADEMTLEVS